MPIHSIAVATDFSPHAARAARAAMAVARHTGASVKLVHADQLVDLRVLGSTGQVPATVEALTNHHRRVVDTHIEEQRIALSALDEDVAVTSLVLSGEVDTSMPEFVGDNQVDMLVVGSHGESGSLRFLFGSKAAKLSRVSPCPVLVVRPGEDEFAPDGFKNIVVAVDHSPVSVPCVELASNLLAEGGQILCLHVWEEPSWMSGAGGGDDEGIASEVVTSVHQREVERMESFVAALSGPQNIQSLLRRGHPASEILEEVEQGADLVVVGSHRRQGLEHLVGTVADRVLRHSKVPVALVPHYEVQEA